MRTIAYSETPMGVDLTVLWIVYIDICNSERTPYVICERYTRSSELWHFGTTILICHDIPLSSRLFHVTMLAE